MNRSRRGAYDWETREKRGFRRGPKFMSHHLHVKYLLVGGGLASSSAAEAIREIDREGSIALVAQEVNRPYHRPPLSKEYLRRQKPRAEVFTHVPDWFESNGVEVRTGRRVSQLEV